MIVYSSWRVHEYLNQMFLQKLLWHFTQNPKCQPHGSTKGKVTRNRAIRIHHPGALQLVPIHITDVWDISMDKYLPTTGGVRWSREFTRNVLQPMKLFLRYHSDKTSKRPTLASCPCLINCAIFSFLCVHSLGGLLPLNEEGVCSQDNQLWYYISMN